ncbi:MAG: hypothetical protein O9262_12380 [Cyclobacteriaceae bacterium]|nr:hypothetical protein [Cyclobacteriaceae bacterium]
MEKIKWTIQIAILSTLFMLPIDSKCQESVTARKITAKDSVAITRYLKHTEKNRLYFATLPTINNPIKLNFKIPQVKVYNAADYYVDGRFSCMPFNSWGPHQVPFHLHQPIFIQVRER